jgi:toxin-antitoxin system PIN domain toxin
VAATLLDVNLLLALAWPQHVHHAVSHRWFRARRKDGWATCPLTELAFVRLSSQPAVVKTSVSVQDALAALETSTGSEEHQFWPMQVRMQKIRIEIRERLMGHQQLADALLLDLAIRNGGRLATFDRRIERLLSSGSPHRGTLEILELD